jgi:hypothetical protein
MIVRYDDAPDAVKRVARTLHNWDSDTELKMGLDALIRGFEALV